MRVTGDGPEIYQTLIADLLTWKTEAGGMVGDGLTSESFTICRRGEKEHSGFNV